MSLIFYIKKKKKNTDRRKYVNSWKFQVIGPELLLQA